MRHERCMESTKSSPHFEPLNTGLTDPELNCVCMRFSNRSQPSTILGPYYYTTVVIINFKSSPQLSVVSAQDVEMHSHTGAYSYHSKAASTSVMRAPPKGLCTSHPVKYRTLGADHGKNPTQSIGAFSAGRNASTCRKGCQAAHSILLEAPGKDRACRNFVCMTMGTPGIPPKKKKMSSVMGGSQSPLKTYFHPFLVGGLVAIFYFPRNIGNVIIPIDELIFFERGG